MPDISGSNTVPSKKPVDPIGWGPLTAIVVTVILYFLSQFVGSFILLGYAHLQGLDATQIKDLAAQTVPQFVYVSIVEALTLGTLWLFIRRYKANFKTLGLRRPKLKDPVWTLIGFGVYFPLLAGSMFLIHHFIPSVNLDQAQQIGFETAHGASLVLVFLSLVIMPPIAEEIVARGFLYLGLRKKLPVITAALATSFIFALPHLQFGSGEPLLWTAAVDTFILSMVLVWLRERTGGLWASIGLHTIKNLLAFLALFVFVR